ncbi:NAD(P)/FAD-dependent oxidoreductase [soil metagenome]
MTSNEIAAVSDSVARWLTDFEAALAAKDSALLRQLFVEESHWRDLESFTWDTAQVHGIDGIEELLFRNVDLIRPFNFRIAQGLEFDSVKITQTIDVFIQFETEAGKGGGFMYFLPDETTPWGVRAFLLFTRLEELRGWETPSEVDRPHAMGVHGKGGDLHKNWLDYRTEHQKFADRDPVVLVAGGGHSGIMAAMYLEKLGVETLVIDKNERVGDNWRKRYHSLALHNPINLCHMPFLPFPDSYPQYLPKDKVANWLEFYVDSMDINFWTSTEFVSAEYDDAADQWNATIRQADGTVRVMHPKHVIMATGGVGGVPNIPVLDGIDSVAGDVMHSSKFPGGGTYAGKNALVVGMGTSAHDIAYDLYNNGANVTMLQRNPTTIVNLDTANAAYSNYFDGTAHWKEADVKGAAAFQYPLLVSGLTEYTEYAVEADKELHQRLEAVGMRLDAGEDNTGWLMKFLRYGGGYYLNIGASDVIADGGIKIIQSADLETFVAEGARMKDGNVLPFDVIVLATGYQNQQTEVENYFGAEVAEKVGVIAGFGPDGELNVSWKPTEQKGLWVMIGSFQQCRQNAPAMTLRIKAELEGIIPEPLRKKYASDSVSA